VIRGNSRKTSHAGGLAKAERPKTGKKLKTAKEHSDNPDRRGIAFGGRGRDVFLTEDFVCHNRDAFDTGHAFRVSTSRDLPRPREPRLTTDSESGHRHQISVLGNTQLNTAPLRNGRWFCVSAFIRVHSRSSSCSFAVALAAMLVSTRREPDVAICELSIDPD
jgi:hypothetical protein